MYGFSLTIYTFVHIAYGLFIAFDQKSCVFWLYCFFKSYWYTIDLSFIQAATGLHIFLTTTEIVYPVLVILM